MLKHFLILCADLVAFRKYSLTNLEKLLEKEIPYIQLNFRNNSNCSTSYKISNNLKSGFVT